MCGKYVFTRWCTERSINNDFDCAQRHLCSSISPNRSHRCAAPSLSSHNDIRRIPLSGLRLLSGFEVVLLLRKGEKNPASTASLRSAFGIDAISVFMNATMAKAVAPSTTMTGKPNK